MPSPQGAPRSPADVAEANIALSSAGVAEANIALSSAGVAEANIALSSAGSPSLEVLEALEIQNAVSNLEARLDSLEIDIARQTGSREDDARRLTGDMAVMKARVEDALQAFSGTADDLRAITTDVEKRLDDVVKRALGTEHPAAPAMRAELRAQIDGMMAGVGDVLESMAGETRERIEALGAQMRQIQDGMLKIAEHVGTLAPIAERLASLEATVAKLDQDR